MIRAAYTMCILWVLLVFSTPLEGQIDIRLTTHTDTVKMGENLMLDIILEPEQDLQINALSLNVFDSLGLAKYLFPEDSILAEADHIPVDFELREPGNWQLSTDTYLVGSNGDSFEEDASGKIHNQVTLTIWDPGQFIILPDELTWIDSGGQEHIYYPETKEGILVHVVGPDEPATGDIEMKPIKDILREGWHWSDFKWLIIAVGSIAFFLFLISRPTRQRKRQVKKQMKEIVIRPAHEIALEKLKSLQEAGLWQKGEIKAFQSELSYIIREYLENRYRIKALESTTGEIIRDLSQARLSNEDVSDLRNLLEISDLVKFAKAKPDEGIHEQFLTKAFDFIGRTKEIKEEKA